MKKKAAYMKMSPEAEEAMRVINSLQDKLTSRLREKYMWPEALFGIKPATEDAEFEVVSSKIKEDEPSSKR